MEESENSRKSEKEKIDEKTKEEIIEDIEESGVSEEIAEKEEKIAEQTEEKFEEILEKQEEPKKEEEKAETEVEERREENYEKDTHKQEVQERREEKEEFEEEPKKEEQPIKEPIKLDKEKRLGGFRFTFLIMAALLLVGLLAEKIPFIKNSMAFVLDPTAGWLLNWNLTLGMFTIVFVITLILTIVQKYGTDQEALKELKKEQKVLQEEMKKHRSNPQKVAELSKKQMEFMPRTFRLTSRTLIYTGLPLILFFSWFREFFAAPELEGFKFFGFLGWFWFYLIFAMVFSIILRKALKVA